MTHEEQVAQKQREFWRVRYNIWLNTWRGKFWRLRQGLPEWWKTKDHEVKFKDEL